MEKNHLWGYCSFDKMSKSWGGTQGKETWSVLLFKHKMGKYFDAWGWVLVKRYTHITTTPVLHTEKVPTISVLKPHTMTWKNTGSFPHCIVLVAAKTPALSWIYKCCNDFRKQFIVCCSSLTFDFLFLTRSQGALRGKGAVVWHEMWPCPGWSYPACRPWPPRILDPHPLLHPP